MKPEGWGPWNVRAVNALVHLPSGLELRIGIRTPDGEEHWELRWKQMERLGGWSENVDGVGAVQRACQLVWRTGASRVVVSITVNGNYLNVDLEPYREEDAEVTLLMQLDYPWSEWLSRPSDGHPVAAVTVWGETREAHSLELKIPLTQTRLFEFHDVRTDSLPGVEVVEGEAPIAVRLGNGILVSVASESSGQTHFPGPPPPGFPPLDTSDMPGLADLDEVLWRGVAWNTIYHPRLKRLMTPVSRDWCVDDNNFGDYVLFPWDTFFCSVLASRRDKDLAYANVRAVLAEMTDRGMLPNVNGGAGQTLDRSQPPVGAYCVWKLHEKFNDPEFLAEVYPPLKRWHAFWMKYRDGNGDGLLEWGSDPIPAPVDWWKPHTQQAAKWESGLDNSPMYENIPFNEAANTLELADIGLSCLYAADAEALAKMADALGLAGEAQGFREDFAQVSQRINDLLWDEEHGIYCNRHWDGRLSKRWSPTSFYALYAGVATPERAERCVREHLMNPDEFWGEWVIPSISRKDPNFPVQKYWQGRVWPPMNFLCYEGLRRYGFHAEADELAAKSEALFLKEWREEGHIHENYNAITADGDDVNPDDPEGSSDPIYTWGGLLAYIALDARERKQPSESIHR